MPMNKTNDRFQLNCNCRPVWARRHFLSVLRDVLSLPLLQFDKNYCL